jgi:hypothetical protein
MSARERLTTPVTRGQGDPLAFEIWDTKQIRPIKIKKETGNSTSCNMEPEPKKLNNKSAVHTTNFAKQDNLNFA